jgi:hypothetical protein
MWDKFKDPTRIFLEVGKPIKMETGTSCQNLDSWDADFNVRPVLCNLL